MADEKMLVCGYPLREAPIDAMVLVIDRALIDSCIDKFPKADDALRFGAEVRRRLERLAALEERNAILERVREAAIGVLTSSWTGDPFPALRSALNEAEALDPA